MLLRRSACRSSLWLHLPNRARTVAGLSYSSDVNSKQDFVIMTPKSRGETPVDVRSIRVVLSESQQSAQLARKERRRRNSLETSTAMESLTVQTLKELDSPAPVDNVRASRAPLSSVQQSTSSLRPFDSVILRKTTTIFQINIGLYCNQACSHCHVESSPRRKEMMSRETIDRCIELVANSPDVRTVDITGGAPELHPDFRYLVRRLRTLSRPLEIIDRCNLTVVHEPNQEDLVEFLSRHKVRVVASLPCYGKKNVDQQRGNTVFARSISALVHLNNAGYGEDPSLVLDLVYNPLGAFLPPDQVKLEAQYKQQLDKEFGIQFNRLFCLTNMPIKRFRSYLERRGEYVDYMRLLIETFNPAAVESVMCSDTISVRYDGEIYDCDFNQQLAYPTVLKGLNVRDMSSITDPRWQLAKVRTGMHCFGCTAGKGSSCQGEVV